MSDITLTYDQKELSFYSDNGDGWLDQKQIADLFDVDVRSVSRHIQRILDDKELDESTIQHYWKVADDGKRRKIKHYNLHMIIAIGYRINSTKGTKFRIWATDVLSTHIKQGVTVNPQVAQSDPERVQDNFYTQFSPHMKKHLNRHGHTEAYQKERLDNIQARKQLASEITRTIDGKPNFGRIMGMFHVSLTGMTKAQLLQNYEHATRQTSAVDALGSIVVNQMNLLMQSVKMVLENYPDDYIPDDTQTAQIQKLVDKFSGNLRAHLLILAEETGQPIEKLGENSKKKRLL
jgi:hypothetical protein